MKIKFNIHFFIIIGIILTPEISGYPYLVYLQRNIGVVFYDIASDKKKTVLPFYDNNLVSFINDSCKFEGGYLFLHIIDSIEATDDAWQEKYRVIVYKTGIGQNDEAKKVDSYTVIHKSIPFEPYSSETAMVNGIKVITRLGELIVIKDGKQDMLVKQLDKRFHQKTGPGCCDPDISKDGRFCVFVKTKRVKMLPQYPISFLMEVNLSSKEMKVIDQGVVYRPMYSPCNNFILYSNTSQGEESIYKKNKIIYVNESIYVYNRITGEIKKIDKGECPFWILPKHL